MKNTDDLRIAGEKELLTPMQLLEILPMTEKAAETTAKGRRDIEKVLDGTDDRLVVVVGPCSIHDPESAMEYAARLKKLKDELDNDLVIIMRVYFEKPRTTVGWKGLINDPDINGSYNITKGLNQRFKHLERPAFIILRNAHFLNQGPDIRIDPTIIRLGYGAT